MSESQRLWPMWKPVTLRWLNGYEFRIDEDFSIFMYKAPADESSSEPDGKTLRSAKLLQGGRMKEILKLVFDEDDDEAAARYALEQSYGKLRETAAKHAAAADAIARLGIRPASKKKG